MANRPRWRAAHLMAIELTVAGVLLVLAGCSTAPCADFCDYWFPAKFPANPKVAVGGVCVPQGAAVAGPVVGPPPGPGFVGPATPVGPQIQADPPPAPIVATPMAKVP